MRSRCTYLSSRELSVEQTEDLILTRKRRVINKLLEDGVDISEDVGYSVQLTRKGTLIFITVEFSGFSSTSSL